MYSWVCSAIYNNSPCVWCASCASCSSSPPPKGYKNSRSLLTVEWFAKVRINHWISRLSCNLSLNSSITHMASFGNTTSRIHSILSDRISLLDLFFPGFTPISSSIWPLLTGAPSIYGRLLCICGFLVLIGKYGPEYVGKLLEAYFS